MSTLLSFVVECVPMDELFQEHLTEDVPTEGIHRQQEFDRSYSALMKLCRATVEDTRQKSFFIFVSFKIWISFENSSALSLHQYLLKRK